nr:hypothetical protein HK105_006299 [Polyrhizophydium stewartii]
MRFDRRFKDFAADKSAQKRRADIAHTISTAIFSTFEHIAKFDQMVLPARICEQLESALECKAANPGLFLSRAAKALSQLSDINRRMFFNLLLIIRRVAEAGSDKAVQLGMICRFAVPCVFEKRDKMDANGNISWPKQEAIIAALASGLGDLVATLKIIDSGVDLGMDACCEPRCYD